MLEGRPLDFQRLHQGELIGSQSVFCSGSVVLERPSVDALRLPRRSLAVIDNSFSVLIAENELCLLAIGCLISA